MSLSHQIENLFASPFTSFITLQIYWRRRSRPQSDSREGYVGGGGGGEGPSPTAEGDGGGGVGGVGPILQQRATAEVALEK